MNYSNINLIIRINSNVLYELNNTELLQRINYNELLEWTTLNYSNKRFEYFKMIIELFE